MDPAAAEAWIDIVLRRSDELRRKGILSIGFGSASAVISADAPRELTADADDDAPRGAAIVDESANAWTNAASYPSGVVPTMEVDERLPDIEQFEDD